MTPMDWMVVLGGTLMIGWINWYFFLAERRKESAVIAESAREGDTSEEGAE